ncbi:MAG: ATP-binding cassette domain-containing protein [Hymenobacteraceae bacterium]|nr:ATP-binding cassette domain-containing protein [Hymenobacteraceae bacterium]MDX5396074.1 ATP-binding cassette domain-containing protein [Hymenobacteraceae bacterium]MDX5512139.1 ATP-binding cassette domain-containing protein [Hymenobacteraceae bacterium]
MIDVKDLTVQYKQKTVLQQINTTFSSGKVHGIIGLNGAGKTTFFNVLSQVIKPQQGEILFQEKPLKRTDIGYLETQNFFYSSLTGNDYLNVFPKNNQKFNLSTFQKLLQLPLNSLVETYSTGMKKKLALLAILQQEKPIYIFDEPFNGLDLESNHTLELIVQALQQKGKTIFLSSHVLEPLLHTCDQIHLLQHGRFVQTFQKEQFSQIRESLFKTMEQQVKQTLAQAL